jgi:hypothetical protein
VGRATACSWKPAIEAAACQASREPQHTTSALPKRATAVHTSVSRLKSHAEEEQMPSRFNASRRDDRQGGSKQVQRDGGALLPLRFWESALLSFDYGQIRTGNVPPSHHSGACQDPLVVSGRRRRPGPIFTVGSAGWLLSAKHTP